MAEIKRKTIDKVLSWFGVLAVIFLLGIGGLCWWAYSFTSSNVHDQLSAQKIYFPPAAAFAHPVAGTEITPSMIPSVSQYAGQELLTGPQAKAYANDFIAVHLSEVAGGQTYAQVSAASLANPTNTKLKAEAAVLFQGETLRGLLLGDAYAFSTVGMIAMIAAIVCFAAAGVMLILTLLGFWHISRDKI